MRDILIRGDCSRFQCTLKSSIFLCLERCLVSNTMHLLCCAVKRPRVSSKTNLLDRGLSFTFCKQFLSLLVSSIMWCTRHAGRKNYLNLNLCCPTNHRQSLWHGFRRDICVGDEQVYACFIGADHTMETAASDQSHLFENKRPCRRAKQS